MKYIYIIVSLLHIVHWIELMRETTQVTLEAQEDLNDKLITVSESSLKNNDKIEHVTAKTVTQSKEDLPDDPYKVLREEILQCFGSRISKVPAEEDIVCTKIYVPLESDRKEKFIKDQEFKTEKESVEYTRQKENVTENSYKVLREEMLEYFGGRIPNVPADEGTVCSKLYAPSETDKEEKLKSDNEFKTKEEYADYALNDKNNENANACRGNIFPKLISFGNSTLKYLSDPWSASNPSTYLNKLSEKLTRQKQQMRRFNTPTDS